MGSVCFKPSPADAQSKKIDSILSREKYSSSKFVEFLLLGTSDSGKSTVLKQFKLLSQGGLDGSGFSDTDKNLYRKQIQVQLIDNLQQLIHAAIKMNISLEDKIKYSADNIMKVNFIHGENVNSEVFVDVNNVWQSKEIQTLFEQSRELSVRGYNVDNTTPYFFTQLDRILNGEITNEDILRCRFKSMYSVQMEFLYNGLSFKVTDVSGQKSQRKKWLYLMTDALDAVIYCASLNDYDLHLREQMDKNRMIDSLEVFESLCNNKYLENTPFFLFLNKNDLFTKKIEQFDLNTCFPDYTGGLNYDNGLKFIKQKFQDTFQKSLPENSRKNMYIFVTTAIDSSTMEKVISSIRDMIIGNHLEAL